MGFHGAHLLEYISPDRMLVIPERDNHSHAVPQCSTRVHRGGLKVNRPEGEDRELEVSRSSF